MIRTQRLEFSFDDASIGGALYPALEWNLMTAFSTTVFDHLWIPASRGVPRSRQKVMIVLHGRGDSLRAFQSIKQELRQPHLNYLLLNAPRRYGKGYSWYAMEPRHERGVKAAREKLFALVDELKAAGWRTSDLLWMGHSQGCLVASDLVMNHPESFAGLIGVSGYLWFFPGWKRKIARSGARRTPWLITHGTRDRIILPREIRDDVQQLSGGQVPVLYREFPKGHDFDFEREVPFIRGWIARHRARARKAPFSSARVH